MSSASDTACGSQLGLLELCADGCHPRQNLFPTSANSSADRSGRSEDCQASEDCQVSAAQELGQNAQSPPWSGNTPKTGSCRLHRIAEVRQSQGISDRSMCKRLNIDLHRLRELEDPTRDLTLSELRQIQEMLDVPLIDLLEDSNSLSRPIQERAKMGRVMKTASAICDCKLNLRAQRLAQMMKEQLIELMPELAEVSPWPQFGSRRGTDSVARVLAQEVNMNQINAQE